MKKIIIAALAIGLVGSAAQAQSNQVLSRNAVGYVKVTAGSNTLTLVRNDFESINGGSIAVSNLIGTQVPVNSTVMLWNRGVQQYRSGGLTRSGWGTFGSNLVRRGDGFFLRIPSGTGISNYTVYLMGEVPDETTAPTSLTENVTALGMYGYPYPVNTYWTNTPLAKGAAVNDSLMLWSTTNQSYYSFGKTRSGWGAATNVILAPGQGFWFRSSITQQWSEVKPYTWP